MISTYTKSVHNNASQISHSMRVLASVPGRPVHAAEAPVISHDPGIVTPERTTRPDWHVTSSLAQILMCSIMACAVTGADPRYFGAAIRFAKIRDGLNVVMS